MMKFFLLYCIAAIACFSSCKTLKETQQEVELFQQPFDSTSKITYKELVIRPYDQLRIQVLTEASASQEQATIFNLPGNGTGGGGAATNSTSQGNGGSGQYEVDKDSTINYPVLGKIKVAGLTSRQLRDSLSKYLSPYIKDVRVIANISNFSVYAFGQGSAAKILFNEERVTMLDFLSKSAGTISAGNKLDNILVVREDLGTRHYYQVDVRSPKSLYNSPVYQLQQNDLVYVHPTKTRLRQITNGDNSSTVSGVTFFTNLFSSAVSFVLFILTLDNLFRK